MNKVRTEKFNKILMRITGIVLLLFVLSVCLISGLYAKYVSNVGGSSSATVAKWNVETTFYIDTDKKILEPNDRATGYSVTITSTSEVNVKYDIVISFDKNLQEGIIIEIDRENDQSKRTITADGNNKTFTFYNVGILNGNASATHQISFFVDDDTTPLEDVVLSYVGTIEVNAEQAN